MTTSLRHGLALGAALLIALSINMAALAPGALAQQPASRSAAAYTQGVLWKIEGAGAAPSHVFGTIHLADPRVLALPQLVKQTFDTAASFTIEVRFDAANVVELASRMLFMDGRELPDVIGPPLYAKVAALAPELGLPPEVLRRFKPWAVALLIIVPQQDAENILDNRLYQMAMEQKKDLYQLETVDEQVAMFEGMAESEQIALLRYAVENRERLRGRMGLMVDAYLRRDLAELLRVSDEGDMNDPAMKRLNATFMERLLYERNVVMAKRMEPQLREGRAFIAVGALHLHGERGVLARLASRGYRVTRVY